MNDAIARETGERVRRVMETAGVRQTEIAAVLKITQPQVSQRLAGNVDFSITELTAIAEHLSVRVGELIPASSC